MKAKEYTSIMDLISAIQDNGIELTRAFTIKFVENDIYVENKYMLKNFKGSDLVKLLQYASGMHYNTSSIEVDWDNKADIILFK